MLKEVVQAEKKVIASNMKSCRCLKLTCKGKYTVKFTIY